VAGDGRDGRHEEREEVRAGRPALDGSLHLHAFESSKPWFQAGSRTMSGGSANCRGGTAAADLVMCAVQGGGKEASRALTRGELSAQIGVGVMWLEPGDVQRLR
jgi:hypothetical protein